MRPLWSTRPPPEHLRSLSGSPRPAGTGGGFPSGLHHRSASSAQNGALCSRLTPPDAPLRPLTRMECTEPEVWAFWEAGAARHPALGGTACARAGRDDRRPCRVPLPSRPQQVSGDVPEHGPSNETERWRSGPSMWSVFSVSTPGINRAQRRWAVVRS